MDDWATGRVASSGRLGDSGRVRRRLLAAAHVLFVLAVTSLAGVSLVWAAAGWYGYGSLVPEVLPVLLDWPDFLFEPYVPTALYLALAGFLIWWLWPEDRPPGRSPPPDPPRGSLPEPGQGWRASCLTPPEAASTGIHGGIT